MKEKKLVTFHVIFAVFTFLQIMTSSPHSFLNSNVCRISVNVSFFIDGNFHKPVN